MLSNRLAFAALGLACVAAAAGGGYMATRQNVVQQMASTQTPASAAEPAVVPAPVALPATDTARSTALVSEPAATDAKPAPTPERARTEAPAPRAAQASRPSSAQRPASQSRRSDDVQPSGRSSSRVDAPIAREDSATPSPTATAPSETPAPAPRADERVAEAQPAAPVTPPASFEELVVAADSVIGLRTETALSSERARVEDRVEARVVRDVRVGGRVAVPAGTRALGSVVVVERGGRLKERARLGIRFHTLAMADGTRLPISTETIYRYGDAPGDASTKKIGGGAVAGAILGAIIGGGKGAAIGAATGAAGGGAVVMTGDRSEATFPSGADVTARIVSPVTVTIDR